MRYAKGIMWLDDCRIPFVNESDTWKGRIGGFQDEYVGGTCKKHNEDNTKGRFTPNLLVCDDMLNDGSVSKSEGRKIYENEDTNIKNNVYSLGWIRTSSDIKDKGTNSRYYDLDKWFDKMIDEIR